VEEYEDDDFDDEEDDEFDEDDEFEDEDEEYAERRAVREEGGCVIKCPDCGAEYHVTDRRELGAVGLGFQCERCGKRWKIGFFGVCSKCHEEVGFDEHNVLQAVTYGLNIFLGALQKEETFFTKVGDMIRDALPEPRAMGLCPFCKTEQALCPRCHRATPFSSMTRNKKTTVRCKHCGQNMKLP
jgi:predicted Zn finger-like uncharacterized protein